MQIFPLCPFSILLFISRYTTRLIWIRTQLLRTQWQKVLRYPFRFSFLCLFNQMLRPTITPPNTANINDMQMYIACTAIGKCFQHTPTHTAVITDDTNKVMPFALNALICFILLLLNLRYIANFAGDGLLLDYILQYLYFHLCCNQIVDTDT